MPGSIPLLILTLLTFCGYALLIMNPWIVPLFLGPFHVRFPFLDLYAVLAAFDGHRAGLDVMSYPNPMDPLHRPHVYSRWWLYLTSLGFTRQHAVPLGVLSGFLFLVVSLLILRPPTVRSALFRFLIVFAPSAILALERANNDLHIFLLLSAVPPLLARYSHLRLAGSWGLLFLATGLKFYPVPAFAVLLRYVRSTKTFWWITVFTAVAGFALFLVHRGDFRVLSQTVPVPTGLFVFGGLHVFLPWTGNPETAKIAALVVFLVLFAVAGFLVRWRNFQLPEVSPMAAHYYLIGASVLLFCFAINSNYLYRLIFLVFLIPFLTETGRAQNASFSARVIVRVSFALMLILCWADTLFWDWLATMRVAGVEYEDLGSVYRPVFWLLQITAWGFAFLQLVLLHAWIRTDLDRHLRLLFPVKKPAIPARIATPAGLSS